MVPVIKELAAQGITVSIDTMHAEVARAALQNGAQIVNDVSGGRADPAMAPLLAEAEVPWVLMHWRSVGADRPHQAPAYRDVVAEVRAELLAGVDDAVAAGVDPARLIIDPGLGFAKTGQHNWALLHALPELVATGIPVLLGASRKRFLGTLLAGPDGELRPPDGRETATAVISALAALHGAWGVRVHDVRASVDALKVVGAWTQAGWTMADRIELRGLTVRGQHGVFDHERATARTSSSTSPCGSIWPTPAAATTWPTPRLRHAGPAGGRHRRRAAAQPDRDGGRRDRRRVMDDERVHAVEVVVHKPRRRFR